MTAYNEADLANIVEGIRAQIEQLDPGQRATPPSNDLEARQRANTLGPDMDLAGARNYALSATTRFRGRPAPITVSADAALPLSAGLYLITGPTDSGKSLTALGLWAYFNSLGLSPSYQYAYEPGADPLYSVLQMTGGSHEKLLTTLATESRDEQVRKKALASGRDPDAPIDDGTACGVVVFDSLTLAMRQLPAVAEVMKTQSDAAYPGGLTMGDIVGVVAHGSIATKNRTAIIGVANNELLPISSKLGGAIQGVYRVVTPGHLVSTDREVDGRAPKEFIVPWGCMNFASLEMRYGRYRGANTGSTGNRPKSGLAA